MPSREGIRMFVVCGGDGTILAVAGRLDWHACHPGDHPHRHAEQRGPQPGDPGGYPGRHRNPAHGPAHQSGRGHGRVRQGSCGPSSWLVWRGWLRPFSRRPTISSTATWRGSAISWQHWSLPHQPRCTWCWTTKQEIHTQGHVALVSNMPYIGLHFQVGAAAAFNDGLLDVLIFTDLSKMDLLGYAAQKVVGVGTEDPRIQHFQARRVDMDTQPAMPVMADGLEMGEGPLHITVQRHALAVMVGTVGARGCARPRRDC